MADRHGPMRTGRFTVEIDDVEIAGWQSVTIPSSSTEVSEYRESDDPDFEDIVLGATTFQDLEMTRGLQPGDTTLSDWREEVRAGNIDEAIKEVKVTLMDEEGEDVFRWVFEGSLLSYYDPPELDARVEGKVATETVTIVFDKMVEEEP